MLAPRPSSTPRSSVRFFAALVTYRGEENGMREEEFPVHAPDYQSATELAFAYVLQVLRLDEFELRIVGA